MPSIVLCSDQVAVSARTSLGSPVIVHFIVAGTSVLVRNVLSIANWPQCVGDEAEFVALAAAVKEACVLQQSKVICVLACSMLPSHCSLFSRLMPQLMAGIV